MPTCLLCGCSLRGASRTCWEPTPHTTAPPPSARTRTTSTWAPATTSGAQQQQHLAHKVLVGVHITGQAARGSHRVALSGQWRIARNTKCHATNALIVMTCCPCRVQNSSLYFKNATTNKWAWEPAACTSSYFTICEVHTSAFQCPPSPPQSPAPPPPIEDFCECLIEPWSSLCEPLIQT